MNKLMLSLFTLTALLLSACVSHPPPPDWQNNAFAALNSFTSAYLNGNSKVAEFEFARAKTEVARTGRADLVARLELARCAAQVASLDLQACTGYDALAVDAQPAERAYAAFLSGSWAGMEPTLLPMAYRSLVTQAIEVEKSGAMPKAASMSSPQDAQANSALSQIQDPLSRLVAAGSLLQRKQLTLVDLGLAVKTASDQGWRRPLLAWLGVQLKRQQATGNAADASQTQRRIDLVLQTPAK
jgi:hypothetical protein